jgi:hypothetical protein
MARGRRRSGAGAGWEIEVSVRRWPPVPDLPMSNIAPPLTCFYTVPGIRGDDRNEKKMFIADLRGRHGCRERRLVVPALLVVWRCSLLFVVRCPALRAGVIGGCRGSGEPAVLVSFRRPAAFSLLNLGQPAPPTHSADWRGESAAMIFGRVFGIDGPSRPRRCPRPARCTEPTRAAKPLLIILPAFSPTKSPPASSLAQPTPARGGIAGSTRNVTAMCPRTRAMFCVLVHPSRRRRRPPGRYSDRQHDEGEQAQRGATQAGRPCRLMRAVLDAARSGAPPPRAPCRR